MKVYFIHDRLGYEIFKVDNENSLYKIRQGSQDYFKGNTTPFW